MGRTLTMIALVGFAAVGLSVDAQWLDRKTPNIPRTADGKPNLAAPAPRAADGHPDISGVWMGRPVVFGVPDEALTATSKTLLRERESNYLKDRPTFQCQPTGPETIAGFRRIIQTPGVIAIVYETLNSRLIFTDGRKLEADPERVWMGYSVGRWDGDTSSSIASDSTIARGSTRAVCRIQKRFARPSGTGERASDNYRSSSRPPIRVRSRVHGR